MSSSKASAEAYSFQLINQKFRKVSDINTCFDRNKSIRNTIQALENRSIDERVLDEIENISIHTKEESNDNKQIAKSIKHIREYYTNNRVVSNGVVAGISNAQPATTTTTGTTSVPNKQTKVKKAKPLQGKPSAVVAVSISEEEKTIMKLEAISKQLESVSCVKAFKQYIDDNKYRVPKFLESVVASDKSTE